MDVMTLTSSVISVALDHSHVTLFRKQHESTAEVGVTFTLVR